MKFTLTVIFPMALSGVQGGANGGKKGKHDEDYGCGGYGPLSPVKDSITGLYLLELPEGFTYSSYGWTGQIMDDGNPTPTDHDGMAVSGVDGDVISIVRNHECSLDEGPLQILPASATYSEIQYGGNTNVYFDTKHGHWVKSYGSLAGLIRPCAGGSTPWDSWISCEENFSVGPDGKTHGWIFDVPAFGLSNAKPVRSAGRFNHEAAAVDPNTGYVYETEDSDFSGLYKYVMPGAGEHWDEEKGGGKKGKKEKHDEQFFLRDGGDLYAIAVVGECGKDLRGGFADGSSFHVHWVPVTNPMALNTDNEETVKLSAKCSATFRRGEGAWWSEKEDVLYFVSTSGGELELGQVWKYNPRTEILTMVYESRDRENVDNPDNIAIAENGNIILCEDGGSDPKRLVGLTSDGNAFDFARNVIALNEDDLSLIDHYYPGTQENFWDSVTVEDDDGNVIPGERRSFSGQEWAGATFYGDWLFANVQSPGVTFAITGPWEKGAFGEHCRR